VNIDAVLRLLDDEDPEVREALQARLGADRALLDAVWRAAVASDRPIDDDLVRLVLIADAEEIVDAFAAVDDLEGGIWVLPLLHRPRTDWRSPGSAALDAIAARVRDLPGTVTGGSLATFLGEEYAFSGDTSHYHDPRNAYVPLVLERRCGLPITLTALWLLVARRLDLPCEAIAAPGHVVGRWRCDDEWIYVDCFAQGQRIQLADLEARVRSLGEPSILPYLSAASDRALLRRMARNLVHAYAQRGDRVRATIAQGLASA
jgi:hypothetical protein